MFGGPTSVKRGADKVRREREEGRSTWMLADRRISIHESVLVV